MPGTRNSYLAFFVPARSASSLYGLDLHFFGSRLWYQLVLVEQIDRLLDEGGLAVFEMQDELLQPLGVAIADPALQPTVGLLLALHMLALPLCIVLCLGTSFCWLIFLAHMTLVRLKTRLVISYEMCRWR